MTDATPHRSMPWLFIGTVLCGLSVILGASARHGIDSDAARGAETGVRYLMAHGLGLCILGLVQKNRPPKLGGIAGWLFFIGCMLFSGSLWLRAVTGIDQLRSLTPFGGIAFILGWIFFAAATKVKTIA